MNRCGSNAHSLESARRLSTVSEQLDIESSELHYIEAPTLFCTVQHTTLSMVTYRTRVTTASDRTCLTVALLHPSQQACQSQHAEYTGRYLLGSGIVTEEGRLNRTSIDRQKIIARLDQPLDEQEISPTREWSALFQNRKHVRPDHHTSLTLSPISVAMMAWFSVLAVPLPASWLWKRDTDRTRAHIAGQA
jgi:hypothetical protein